MSQIEKTLRDATGVKKKSSESEQDYYSRLIQAVQALPDDDWEAVGRECQLWVNEGARAFNADEDIPGFPDDESEEEEEPEPKAKKKGKKKAKPTAEEEPKKKKAKSNGPVKTGGGIKDRIKRLLLDDPTMNTEELMQELTKGGAEAPSKFTVSGIRAEFRHSLKLLKAEGHLPDLKI